MHPEPARSSASVGPRLCGVRVSFFAVALLAFGLLLWARFLLVTGHPRTAIAHPSAPAQVANAAGETHDAASK